MTRNTKNILITIFFLFFTYCSGKASEAAIKSTKPNNGPDLIGDWYYYDAVKHVRLGERPIFRLLPGYVFIDSLQSICRMEKRAAGTDFSFYPPSLPFIDFPNTSRLENCPEYVFTQDGSQILIAHKDGTEMTPNFMINFLNISEGSKQKAGTEYVVYLQIKPKVGLAGNMLFAPNEAKSKFTAFRVLP